MASLTHEDQMSKDADLMRTYEDTLSRWVQNTTGRTPAPRYYSNGDNGDTGTPGNDGYTDPSRGRLPTFTPQVPVIEVH